MNPNQEEYSIDYLNKISAPAKKPGIDKKFIMLVGGGLLVAIVLVIILASIGSGGASTEKLQTLSVRLDTLSVVTKDARKNIRSNSLRVANADLMIFLTNATNDLKTPLANVGITNDKIDKTLKTKYDGTKLKQTLENARLNVTTYDRTYAGEMSYELETLSALMKDIYQSTNSKSMKDALVKIDDNLSAIHKRLSDFTDTTS